MSTLIHLEPDRTHYPPALKQNPYRQPLPTISAIGNLDILQQPKLALFCSTQCPGNLILQTYDLAQALRNAGICVISGFHTPMEKECLTLLQRGTQPIIHCPARSLDKMRLLKPQQEALAQNQLLLLSPFTTRHHRITAALAQERNQFVGAIANVIFVAHAAPGSKTERFVQQLLASGKPVITFESEENQHLLNFGVKPITVEAIAQEWSNSSLRW